MPLTEQIRTYLTRQKLCLIDPAGFVGQIRPVLGSDWSQPVSYLFGAVALSFALAKVNINLCSERIQRVATIPDLVAGQGTVLVAVILFAVVSWIIFRPLSGSASFSETLALLLYMVSFLLPVLTIVLILGTRSASAILHETILFMPPMRTVGFGGPETGLLGFVVASALTTLCVYWDLFVVWMLWKILVALQRTSRVRAGVCLGITLAVTSLLTHWSAPLVNLLVTVMHPVWELFK